jgi:hypothetical protein
MLARFSLLTVSAHASERMEHVSAMRASSTTVAYCPELAESSTHCANKISVAWNPLSCPCFDLDQPVYGLYTPQHENGRTPIDCRGCGAWC